MQSRIIRLENEQKEQLEKQEEIEKISVIETEKLQQKESDKKEKEELQSKQSKIKTTSKELNITKEKGAYIRANFSVFFGKKQVCHNIGRNHVNFPAIYSGNRSDLSEALLKLIKKVDSNFVINYDFPDEHNVMTWYNSHCVRYNAVGAENSKILIMYK